MTETQRKNLLKLATYLESLPKNYKHFDMWTYADHRGDCEMPMPAPRYAVERPAEFLANCGTVACALGHGPAAGLRMNSKELNANFLFERINWPAYSHRQFGTGDDPKWLDGYGPFDFLFGSDWYEVDNHHYGAAARIRFFLATGKYATHAYSAYRKGSRSKIRRAIDAQTVAA